MERLSITIILFSVIANADCLDPADPYEAYLCYCDPSSEYYDPQYPECDHNGEELSSLETETQTDLLDELDTILFAEEEDTSDDLETDEAEEIDEEYLVIGLGGFNSCVGSKDNGNLTVVGDKVKSHLIDYLVSKGESPYWFISCFWGVTSSSLKVKYSGMQRPVGSTPFETWSWRRIYWDDEGPQTTNERREQGWSTDGRLTEMFYDKLASTIDGYLMDNYAENKRFNIIVVGHSNGGYTALKLADKLFNESYFAMYLNAMAQLRMRTTTLDPISTSCNQATIGFGVNACLRAPSASEVDYTVFADSDDVRVGNYYQDNYSTLHSSELPDEANAVVDVDVNTYPAGSAWGRNAHSDMSGHDPAYNETKQYCINNGLLPR